MILKEKDRIEAQRSIVERENGEVGKCNAYDVISKDEKRKYRIINASQPYLLSGLQADKILGEIQGKELESRILRNSKLPEKERIEREWKTGKQPQ